MNGQLRFGIQCCCAHKAMVTPPPSTMGASYTNMLPTTVNPIVIWHSEVMAWAECRHQQYSYLIVGNNDKEHNMCKCLNLKKKVKYPPSWDGRLFGTIKQIWYPNGGSMMEWIPFGGSVSSPYPHWDGNFVYVINIFQHWHGYDWPYC